MSSRQSVESIPSNPYPEDSEIIKGIDELSDLAEVLRASISRLTSRLSPILKDEGVVLEQKSEEGMPLSHVGNMIKNHRNELDTIIDTINVLTSRVML